MSSEVKSISSKATWALIQENPKAIFIDVRSSMEYLFVGHAKGAINVPWIDEPDWTVDPHFAAHIRQVMLGGASCQPGGNDCPPVLLICRSGRRSLEAGELLIKEGMSEVYNVEHGFEGDLNDQHQRSTLNGWRYDGLPWQQS